MTRVSEFRRDLELDEGRRPVFDARFGPKEIKVPLDRAACAKRDLKRFEAGVIHLRSNTIFAVLNPCVLHLQLPIGSYDILGAETFIKQISEDAKLPIITGIIDQGGFWKNAFQTQVVGEEPDDTAAGGDYRIRINRATEADHGEDLVFL